VLTTLIRAARLVPRSIALAITGTLAKVAWYLAPGLRRQMRASLAVAFPDLPQGERDAIARASLVHLGWGAAEMVTLPRWFSRLDEYVDLSPEARATVERAAARGKGVILVLGHIGNWELTCRIARFLPSSAVIAKRSWHVRIDDLAERSRAGTGVQTFWRNDASTARDMLRLLKSGGGLGILIDQDIRDVQSVFVPFFGRPAATPRSAADLALRFGATVLVVTCHRRGPRAGDGHLVEVKEIPYDPEPADLEAESVRLTAACVAEQERAIRRHPGEWVWMHERWKRSPPAA
jgi:KDO2-lipid IV(A) lauroyltransferase